jgi:hypothetical protein
MKAVVNSLLNKTKNKANLLAHGVRFSIIDFLLKTANSVASFL